MSATAFKCPRCLARGKTWTGSNPICGFTERGRFKTDNWNCATLNDLRDLVEPSQIWSEDDYVAAIPRGRGEPGFLVLCWYKRRGRTDRAFLLSSDWRRPLTLKEAEAILAEAGR